MGEGWRGVDFAGAGVISKIFPRELVDASALIPILPEGGRGKKKRKNKRGEKEKAP